MCSDHGLRRGELLALFWRGKDGVMLSLPAMPRAVGCRAEQPLHCFALLQPLPDYGSQFLRNYFGRKHFWASAEVKALFCIPDLERTKRRFDCSLWKPLSVQVGLSIWVLGTQRQEWLSLQLLLSSRLLNVVLVCLWTGPWSQKGGPHFLSTERCCLPLCWVCVARFW